MNRRESDVLREMLVRLPTTGAMAWRNNTGSLPDPRTGRMISFGLPGSSDVLGVLPGGRFLAVETKHPRTGGQTDQQRAFQAAIEARGGLYILARSWSDVATRLRAEGYSA